MPFINGGGGSGGAAFNGGTITNPLIIHLADPAADPLFQITTSGSEDAVKVRGDGLGGIGNLNLNTDTALSATAVGSGRLTGDPASLSTGLGGISAALDGAQTYCEFDGMAAAVSSAKLSPSTWSFWLDDTNGASKLMVKGKSADGTVVAAAIALA